MARKAKAKTKASPFKTGRVDVKSGGSGTQFLKVGPDDTVQVVPFHGLDELVSADMHEYWRIRPAIFHPCIGDGCPGCAVGNQPRFKGFLPVVTKEGPKVWSFSISVYNQLEEIEDAIEESIGGKVLKFSRKGSGKNDTRYNVIPVGKSMDISDQEAPEFLEAIGPTTVEEIEALLKENGLLGVKYDDIEEGTLVGDDDSDSSVASKFDELE